MEKSADITFDGWTLHRASGELTRDGRRIRLQEQPRQILEALLASPGAVITREELMARLWPKGIVEFETGLNTAVRKLRAALGDEADTPRYIETLPRRGYRFIGTITPEAPPPVVDSVRGSRMRLWAIIGSSILVIGFAAAFFVAKRPPAQIAATHVPVADSLAVLPFKPLLPESRNAALEMGMADTLIAQLSNLPGVTISPLSSVRSYATVDQDPLAAGRALRVETVLDGSIQLDEQRVRVSARLLRVNDGGSLWSAQFDEPMKDIFAVQDVIAEQVVQALAVTLSAAAQQRLQHKHTANPRAYQSYVSGLYKWQRRSPDAVRDFETAVRIDPDYALAWSGLSSALSIQAIFGFEPPGRVFPRAKEAAAKSLALDAELAEAYAAFALVLVQYEHRYAEAEKMYLSAIALNKNAAPTWQRLAIARAYQGNIEQALADIQHASALEPTTLSIAVNIGMLHHYNRAYDEAIAQLGRVLELEPRYDFGHNLMGRSLLEKGDIKGALKHFKATSQPSPGSDGDLGRAYARAGRVAEARAEIKRLEQRAREGFGVAYDLAAIHAALGDIPQACAALERALDDYSTNIGFLRLDPAIDALRRAPCYAVVERRLYGS
jgi:TolB-like protein/DNA-binding winged helix-turn-helix (wHTH) protein/Flp pilus assembly protein TadD